jgi:hypothetical protein
MSQDNVNDEDVEGWLSEAKAQRLIPIRFQIGGKYIVRSQYRQ